MIPAFLRRIGHVIQGMLILIDIAACFAWIAPLYLVGLADRPTGRQMISCYVGRALINGHRWARIAARVIDAVMGKSHCLLMANRYAGFAD